MQPELIQRLQQQTEAELGRRAKRIAPDFPALPPLPAARYVDPRLYALEQQHVFGRQWLYAGEASELPEPGSFKLWDKAGVPVLLVRDGDGLIRAFYNSCRHRGASLVAAERGTVKAFACNFHCWTYALDGALRSVPDEHEFPALDKSTLGLRPLRCEMLGNLIFINQDPHARPLMEHLGRAGQEIAHFDFDRRRVIHSMQFEIDCNWKIAIDAFAESYHLFRTHRDTVAPVFESHGQVLRLWPDGHSFMLTAARREARGNWIMDTGSQDPRHELTRSEQLSVTIFPNIIMALGEFIFPIFNFWPMGLSKTRFEAVLTTTRPIDDEERAQAHVAAEQLKVILLEDASNMSAIQTSVEKGLLEHVVLGCQERRIYQFHEAIDRQIGVDRIPPELRVESVTAPHIES